MRRSSARAAVVDLDRHLRGDGDGVHWTLDGSEDLNANLVRLDPHHAMDAHTNDEVDVLIVVLAGTGRLTVDGRTSRLAPHVVAHVPQGTQRTVEAGAQGLAYLTTHRRRGPLGIRPDAPRRRVEDPPEDPGGDPACWAHLFADADAETDSDADTDDAGR